MTQLVPLTAATWTELPITKAAIIRHKAGSSSILYAQDSSVPAGDLSLIKVFDESTIGEKVSVDGVLDGNKVYAYSVSGASKLSVTNVESTSAPDGVYSGERASNVQFYDESNKKLGKQWEISREIENVTAGQRIFSVMKVGSTYPIDLKARVLGGTDEGVIGKLYWLTSDDIQSLGTPDKWFNFRIDLARQGIQPETKIYPENEVVFAGGLTAVDLAIESRKVGADAFRITSPVAAAGGVPAATVGGNRIGYQDEYAMFEILSKSAQTVTANLEIYEGDLDLPLA